MKNGLLYRERLSSNRTLSLFVALTIVLLLLVLWRRDVRGMDALAVTLFVFCGIFLFYSVNYRTLIIQLNADTLKLKFGLFTWTVPLDNIADCQLDALPKFLEYGGAGIHFFTVHNRYRASFNFLEYPRVVVTFKQKRGLVRDLSFSTRKPDEVMRLIQERMLGVKFSK